MEYRPSELADELKCRADTIRRVYIPAGCPHRRDAAGHLWIVGTEFRGWALATLKRGKIPLSDDEVYCLKCNEPVKMTGRLTVKPVNRYLEMVSGECPNCGRV